MEDNSPYQASRVAPAIQPPLDPVPHAISGPIRQMWILLAGLGVLIMILAIVATVSAYRVPGSSKLASSFILLIGAIVGAMYGGVAFGVYKRSRVVACMVLMLLALLLLGTLFGGAGISMGRLGFWTVSIFICVRGTLAIFRHHRFMADEKRRPPRRRLSDDPAFAPKPAALD